LLNLSSSHFDPISRSGIGTMLRLSSWRVEDEAFGRLERAVQLERRAAGERDAVFKEQLLTQAQAYRKLAAKRAKDYGLPAPSPPDGAGLCSA
jgi:hypothetical protein